MNTYRRKNTLFNKLKSYLTWTFKYYIKCRRMRPCGHAVCSQKQTVCWSFISGKIRYLLWSIFKKTIYSKFKFKCLVKICSSQKWNINSKGTLYASVQSWQINSIRTTSEIYQNLAARIHLLKVLRTARESATEAKHHTWKPLDPVYFKFFWNNETATKKL